MTAEERKTWFTKVILASRSVIMECMYMSPWHTYGAFLSVETDVVETGHWLLVFLILNLMFISMLAGTANLKVRS